MTTTSEQTFLEYVDTIGLSTMEGRGFYYPSDTAVGSDGRLYVVNRSIETDIRGIRITVCDLDHEYYGTFGGFGEGNGQFIYPTSIAIDSRDRFYVGDEHLNRIIVFDQSKEPLSTWGVLGSGPGELDGPSGLAFDGDDILYVVDHRNHRVPEVHRRRRLPVELRLRGRRGRRAQVSLGRGPGPQRRRLRR